MIKTEFLNDETFIKHYSDAGMMLRQNETGLLYSDPVDLVPCQYTYTETDIPCNIESNEEQNVDEYKEDITESEEPMEQ